MSDTPTTPTPSTPTTLQKSLRAVAVFVGGALTLWLAKSLNIEIPVEIGDGIVGLIEMGLAALVGWVIARIFPKS